MIAPKLAKLELQIMEALWSRGPCSIREIQEFFPESGRPAYSTIQTTVYRLEKKRALRRAKRIGNADIMESILSRDQAQASLIDALLDLFGGKPQPIMSHLIESGTVTLEDVRAAEKVLLERRKKKS